LNSLVNTKRFFAPVIVDDEELGSSGTRGKIFICCLISTIQNSDLG